MAPKQNRTPIIVALITVVGGIVVAVIGKLSFDSHNKAPAGNVSAPHAALTPAAPARIYAPVTYAEIVAIVDDNSRTEIQKDDDLDRFVEKWVTWRGYVRNVAKDRDSFFVFTSIKKGDQDARPNLMMKLTSSEKDLLKTLKFEDEIEFEGQLIRSGVGNIYLQNAVIRRKL